MVSPVGLAAGSQAGDLDPSWGGTGTVTTAFPGAYAFADGAAIRGNTFTAVGGVQSGSTRGDFAIARYRDDGSLDPTFGNGGEVTTDFGLGDDLATAAAYQGDKLVVVGYTSPDTVNFSWAIARYNWDGSLDQTFGSGGKVVTSFGDGNDFADAVAVGEDRIVVAGTATTVSGGKDFALAMYTDNGSLDPSFGAGGKVTTDFYGKTDAANGVVFQEDRIIAAGYAQNANYDFALAAYTRRGALDSHFGVGGKVTTDFGKGDDFAHAIDVKGDYIVAVGSAATGTPNNNDFAAAEYTSRGKLNRHFGAGGKTTMDLGGDDVAFAGKFQEDGSVVAVGSTPSGGFGPPDYFAVARWTPLGQRDPGFGHGTGFTTTPIGADSAAYAMALGPDQKIYAAGFSDNNFAVARYFGQSSEGDEEHGHKPH